MVTSIKFLDSNPDGVSKIRSPFWEPLVARIIIYWGLFWESLFMETLICQDRRWSCQGLSNLVEWVIGHDNKELV